MFRSPATSNALRLQRSGSFFSTIPVSCQAPVTRVGDQKASADAPGKAAAQQQGRPPEERGGPQRSALPNPTWVLQPGAAPQHSGQERLPSSPAGGARAPLPRLSAPPVAASLPSAGSGPRTEEEPQDLQITGLPTLLGVPQRGGGNRGQHTPHTAMWCVVCMTSGVCVCVCLATGLEHLPLLLAALPLALPAATCWQCDIVVLSAVRAPRRFQLHRIKAALARAAEEDPARSPSLQGLNPSWAEPSGRGCPLLVILPHSSVASDSFEHQ